jgi:uncharacterized membrane protein
MRSIRSVDQQSLKAVETPSAQRGGGRRFRREGDGLEFDRAVFFSDAIFAIAVTLIVVTIELPPDISDAELSDALAEVAPQIMSFFISFAVIGFFWVKHHRFVAALVGMTRPLLVLNLAYLAAIAFTPFPTDVFGEHTDSAVAVSLYAATLGAVSLLEMALIVCAQVTGALREPLPPGALRWVLLASGIPVVVFTVSIPIAAVSTTAATYFWLMIIPTEIVVGRKVGATGSLDL